MIHCRWLAIQAVLISGLGLLFYSEFATYWSYYERWTKLGAGNYISDGSPTPVSVLLVADPQLVGKQDEPMWPLGTLTRWDCDRYLKRTFGAAVAHTKPDVVVFLGDLIDEGEKATDDEWNRYVLRFSAIFAPRRPDHYISVFLPGDNDVGGEGVPVMESNVKRFEEAFPKRETFHVNFLQIFVRDKLTSRAEKPLGHYEPGSFRLIVSHLPFVTHKSESNANIKVGAHTHVSSITWSRREKQPNGEPLVRRIPLPEPGERTRFRFDTNEIFPRIVVPTCSYRMGVPETGYGHLLIYPDGIADYAVLWSPPRFKQLYYDAAAGCLLLLYLLLSPRPLRSFGALRHRGKFF